MTDLLYRWPAAARFGRVVPKTKFYQHGSVSAALREQFVAQVQRITWAFKLAEATINLPGSAAVPEIQVFEVDAKGDDVSGAVLAAIEKAVTTPIVFEVAVGEGDSRRSRMVAAHKQLGTGAPKVGTYYRTGWQPAGAERVPLPTAISLDALYAALLKPLMAVTVRPGEALSEVAARLEAARKLEKEVTALRRKIRAEAQFNRKVELRHALKIKQSELDSLRRLGADVERRPDGAAALGGQA